MNILVTGGSGFIGSHFIESIIDLPEVVKVVNVDCLTYAGTIENTNAFKFHPKYTFHKADIRNAHILAEVIASEGIDHIVHLAAESHVDRSIKSPGDFITTNVIGTFNLLECARAFGVKKFLHVSTDEVFGSIESGSFNEESPYRPNSPYSASKASSDLLVRAYHQTYGLPTLITNCCNNYGPRQYPEKLIPVVIKACMNKTPIPVYGDGLQVRDWIHVKDHCEFLWQLLMRGAVGSSYCIGGTPMTNIRLIEDICEVFDDLSGHDVGVSHKLIIQVTDRLGHDRRYSVDDLKLRMLIYPDPPAVNFKDGLRETVKWYLGNLCVA